MELFEFEPGGSTSWSNNVPDPLLSADTLPDFTYDLENSKGKEDGKGNYGKEVTAAELPISKGIAGVSMVLEPGVMRELLWHATAAEWGFVLSGNVRSVGFGSCVTRTGGSRTSASSRHSTSADATTTSG